MPDFEMEMHTYFNKWFQHVHRSLLLKEKHNTHEVITNNMLYKIRDEAGARATELAFMNLCAVRSKMKMILHPSQQSNDTREATNLKCDNEDENRCMETIDVSGTVVPRKENVVQVCYDVYMMTNKNDALCTNVTNTPQSIPSVLERGSFVRFNRDYSRADCRICDRSQADGVGSQGNEGRGVPLHVQEGRIGAFSRFLRPSQRRTQRRAARRRARRIGDNQLRYMEEAFGDMGRRDDLHVGLYPLDDLIDAANRETTQNFTTWFGQLEEREYAARRYVEQADYMEWSRLYTSWGLHFHGMVYIELDRMRMYQDHERERQLLYCLYTQRYNARKFIRNERNRAIVRPLQFYGEGRVRLQGRRERGGMRPGR